MKKSTAWIAALAVVIATTAGAVFTAIASPLPDDELVFNGNFEAGTGLTSSKSGDNKDKFQGTWTGTSSYLPGWTLEGNGCGKSRATGTYIPTSVDVGLYALWTKTANTDAGQYSRFYQDVTVPEDGDYVLSFNYGGRKDGNTSYAGQNIAIYLSPVVDGSVPEERVVVSYYINETPLTNRMETAVSLTAGTWRLRFNTQSKADRSTWFDAISLKPKKSILVNGFFDEGSKGTANRGLWGSVVDAGFSCPGWTLSPNDGSIGLGLTEFHPQNNTGGTVWIGKGVPVCKHALFIQSNTAKAGTAYQDVEITEPGNYKLSFRHTARPGKTGQAMNVLFGRLTAAKTALDDTDRVTRFTDTTTEWIGANHTVVALAPGRYRLEFRSEIMSSDTATLIDNVRLEPDDGNLVRNGDIESASIKSASTYNHWGNYMSTTGVSNPYWAVSSANKVGVAVPNGTWMYNSAPVGKFAMYIQTGKSDHPNVYAYQDRDITVPGTYSIKYNYVARPNGSSAAYSGQKLSTVFGLLRSTAGDGDIQVLAHDVKTVSNTAALEAFSTNVVVTTPHTYRFRLWATAQGANEKDEASVIDRASITRVPRRIYWTGEGDGETLNDATNWDVDAFAVGDDLCFTNDAPLALKLTGAMTPGGLNLFGAASVSIDGVVEGEGGTAATNALSIAWIASSNEAAAGIFNCPVNFYGDYIADSSATNRFLLGATARGWGYATAAGAFLDGDFEFTSDTLALSDDVTVAPGRTLRAVGLTGVNNNSITIGDNAKVILTGDLATASGATALLEVKIAETAELWATNSTALASQHFFTASRSKGTVNVGGVVLNTANQGTGLYAARINIGSGGITCNGSANNVFMDVAGDNSVASGMTFGAFADWTWARAGEQLTYLYKNTYVFDTLDCFDGETPRTITLAFSSDEYRDTSVIRKINPGTLVLANLNYFLGGVRVEGGIVRVSADQGSGTGPATVSSGATLEVVSGGVLRNSSVTVADGGTLALGDGGTLVSPVSSEGEVRVSGAATITAGGSIAITGGGTLAFDEGAKIIVGSDVAAGTTLVTGAGLTAQDLAEHFETPYGAVSIDGSGNVVYSSAIEWATGGVWAEDDIYFGYANALNGGYVSNVLAAATVAGTGISRYSQAATASAAVLVDGNVHMPSGYPDYNIIYGIQQGTFTYTFASPTNIAEIAIFSRWGNGGRDGMRISDVLVQHEGSDEWQSAVPNELSIGIGDNNSSPGAMVAVLRRKDGLDLATGVTGVRLVFPSGQDNSGSGFTEFAAFDRVVSANSWTWNGNAGNALFSDAGNWQDSSGNAAGAAGDVFAPAVKDTLSIPASTQVTVDTAVDVAVVRLGGGVTLANPAADAGTGAVATNTITCSAIVNADGGESVVDCAVRFIDPYNVAAADVVRFAGGATAARMGKLSASDCSRVLAGDITIAADFDVIDASADYWCVTNASRFTAGKLKKNDASGNVNGTPNFRVCEGGYAHFTSVDSGRDRFKLSVQGELEVDDYYDTKSVKVVKGTDTGKTFDGDIGYSGDEAFAGSTIRAGGIRRTRYSTNSNYTDYMTYLYPANYYIGSLGIGLTYSQYSMMFTGCEKHIYATDDFTIYNYTGATPSNPADWGVYIAADTTLDTQGHTVTWTAGAVINLSSTFTKAGEGTLVMQPRGATCEGAGNAVVVAGGTLEARACTLSGAATWSSVFGGVPVTVKDGATFKIADDVTSVTNAVTLEEGATLDIQSITSRSSEAASVGALSATGPATVRLSGTLPDSVFSNGTNFVIAASCDAATLANLSLDGSGLVYETEGTCAGVRFKIEDGKLVASITPYFFIRISESGPDELQIPLRWIYDSGAAASSDSAAAVAEALAKPGANGIPVWQSYCLGLEPTNSQSVVLCIPAPDQPVDAGDFKFMTNVAVPENMSGVAVKASLERKSSGDWVRQETCTVEHGTPVEFTASADPFSALSFFA